MATKTLIDISDETLNRLEQDFAGLVSPTALLRVLVLKYTNGECPVSIEDLARYVPNVVRVKKASQR